MYEQASRSRTGEVNAKATKEYNRFARQVLKRPQHSEF